ncbi:MAG: SBBP repeat-containing protein [Deltaproteobacteria bacterium]|nr:SBBP repeat-containing protein [Deltaproteobacteria bacterium]
MRTRFRSTAKGLGWFVAAALLGTTTLGHAQDLLWAKKAGGPATDEGYSITTDSSGNSYVTGRFQGSSVFGPGEGGQTTLVSGGLVDIFVAKYDADGLLVWVKRAGGEGTNEGHAITVDSSGNSYVTGFFQNTATFGPGEANETTFSAQGGNADIFIAKYNAAGTLQWAKQAGSGNGDTGVGGFAEEGLGVGIDGNGNVYVTGFFQSTIVVFGPGETNETLINVPGGGREIFLAKFNNADGDLVWVTHAGGVGDDEGHALAVDSTGNSYITGSFQNTATFGTSPNTATVTSAASGDVFVAKYDTTGALVWVKRAGGGSEDEGQGIAADGSGKSYVTGRFTGTNVTFGPGETNQTILSAGHGNDSDIFVAGFNMNGTLAWAKRAGGLSGTSGPSPDEGTSITTDSAGNSYVAGFFNNTATFGPGETFQTALTASGVQEDIFVAAYSPTGTLAWARRAGGTNRDEGYGVAVRSGEAHVTGRIQGANVIFGLGETNQTTLNTSAADIFVAKYKGPTCGDGQIGFGETCDDGNTMGDDGCSNTCQTEPGYECPIPGQPCTPVCGDGIIKGNEQCDQGDLNGQPGSCCTDTCTFATAGSTCRASLGLCDVAETCNGTSGECPTDVVASPGATCRASGGVCDLAEQCDGEGGACPADTFKTTDTVCHASTGLCDAAETCTGESAACPADIFAPGGTVCRAGAGACDVAEICSGSSATCPADILETGGTTCRGSAGVCDIAETCTGSSATCPADSFVANTVQCRAGTGVCDTAETCTGSSATCPDDTLASADTICRPGNGACDAAETCTGSSTVCPPDSLAAPGTVCRPSVGGCDAAETCTGSSSICPADMIAAAGVVCRAAVGVCDREETCDGTSGACPPDSVEPPTTECRADTDGDNCDDVPEFCTGDSGECPPDSPTVVTMGCTVNGIPDQPCQGGDGKDTIVGTDGRDVIRGGAGNDTLRGQQGDDIICGEEGNDTLIGALGNDILIGGDGRDVLRGNGSDDVISEETDHDRLFGGEGNDTLIGGDGADRLEGGDGNDKLIGNFGDDLLLGGPGKDRLSGDVGDDELDGGSEDDKLDGGPGTDMCTNGEKVKRCEL